MIFVYSVFANQREAKRIGRALLREKLAACVNIVPVDSMYIWQKKIIKDKEVIALIKTRKGNFNKVEKFILEKHSYDTPCILEIPMTRVNKKYLSWLNNVIPK
jgi:periplasmic divalent cation tolerance protein